MGYDGGFSKIRMKINNQNQLNDYYLKLRDKIYNIIGDDNFYKFESSAVDLFYLDNNWIQTHILCKIINLNNYEIDQVNFTYISKEVLEDYINKLHQEDITDYEYIEDIKKLEKLYKEFDWNNDTLVFSYSY